MKNNLQAKVLSEFNKINIFDNNLEVVTNYEIGKGTFNYKADIAFILNGILIAVIDLKINRFNKNINYPSLDPFLINDWLKNTAISNIRFLVLSDGETYEVYDNLRVINVAKYKINGLIDLFLENLNDQVERVKSDITNIILKVVKNSKIKRINDFFKLKMDIVINSIYYDPKHKVFSLDSIQKNSLEDDFFKALLDNGKPITRIYKYTTLDTAFKILQSDSFRMNCIIGMNDISEINYVENFFEEKSNLGKVKVNSTEEHWQKVDANNRRFISSFSLKNDELTQWRLYAEDSKGVCLGFDVNNLVSDENLILQTVNYGKSENHHPELELIINIIQELENKLSIRFSFKRFYIWKHFFKPYNFSIEKEVRLIYISKKNEPNEIKWDIVPSYGIVSPYIEIKSSLIRLPIILNTLILGSNCHNKNLNVSQLKSYLRNLKNKQNNLIIEDYKNIVVDSSKIYNYRTKNNE